MHSPKHKWNSKNENENKNERENAICCESFEQKKKNRSKNEKEVIFGPQTISIWNYFVIECHVFLLLRQLKTHTEWSKTRRNKQNAALFCRGETMTELRAMRRTKVSSHRWSARDGVPFSPSEHNGLDIRFRQFHFTLRNATWLFRRFHFLLFSFAFWVARACARENFTRDSESAYAHEIWMQNEKDTRETIRNQREKSAQNSRQTTDRRHKHYYQCRNI